MLPIEIILVIIINVIILGSYLLFSLQIHKNKSKIRQSLLNFIGLIMLTGVFLTLSFAFLYNLNILSGIFKMLGIETAVFSLYYLNQYSRIISRLKSGIKHNLKTIFFYIITPIIILLPYNQWNFVNIYDTEPIAIQPFTMIIIIGLAIYVFSTTITRSEKATNKLLDPALKESYKWVNRSFKYICLSIPSLIGTVVYYFTPPQHIELVAIIEIILLLIGAVGVIGCFFEIYVGLTLPKRMVKKLYEKYQPMWSQNMDEEMDEEKFETQLKKLQELIFD